MITNRRLQNRFQKPSIIESQKRERLSSSNSRFLASIYIHEPSRIVFREIRGYSINSAKVSRGKQRVETWPGHSSSAEFMASWGGGRQRCRAGLTNVPRLNLKPPASRSLPVDYGLDKSFLENGRATPPLHLSFPVRFCPCTSSHPDRFIRATFIYWIRVLEVTRRSCT